MSFPNVFLRNVGGRHYVYAPLADMTLEVDADVACLVGSLLGGARDPSSVIAEQWYDFLKSASSFQPPPDNSPRHFFADVDEELSFQPTSTTISLTSGCNLRCVYCYIHGGENYRSMPLETAQATIDFIADNALRQGLESISIVFHGEGEPTFNWRLFEAVVLYAEAATEKRNLGLALGLQTNGLFNATQRAFICEKFDTISFSLDGVDSVQARQRPTPNGKPSFPAISENLIAMGKMGINVPVRAVVTPETLGEMENLVDFLAASTTVDTLNFEPLDNRGRGKDVAVGENFDKAFAARLLEVTGYARKKGISVEYSGCSKHAKTGFCGATGSGLNLVVMSDGTVSSCYEVPSEAHELGSFFVYGRYDKEEKRFLFDKDKLKRLMTYRAKDNSPCQTCHAQWSCGADCLTGYSLDALVNGGVSSRCSTNRVLNTALMVSNLKAVTPVSSQEAALSATGN